MMKQEDIIKFALEEDIGKGDVTSNSIIPEDKKANAVIISKDNGILCGVDIAEKAFHAFDESLVFEKMLKDGDKLKKGDIIAKIKGKARSILSCERTSLNFLQKLSGRI